MKRLTALFLALIMLAPCLSAAAYKSEAKDDTAKITTAGFVSRRVELGGKQLGISAPLAMVAFNGNTVPTLYLPLAATVNALGHTFTVDKKKKIFAISEAATETPATGSATATSTAAITSAKKSEIQITLGDRTVTFTNQLPNGPVHLWTKGGSGVLYVPARILTELGYRWSLDVISGTLWIA